MRGNKRMTWLEIINIRTAGKTEFMDALNFCCDMQHDLEAKGTVDVNLYRSTSYETDLSVHLCWDSAMASPAKTSLGIQLSKLLTRFGLIDHKVWQSVQINKDGGDL
jgi:hypothetical protein